VASHDRFRPCVSFMSVSPHVSPRPIRGRQYR
jgi:hypothetical protein